MSTTDKTSSPDKAGAKRSRSAGRNKPGKAPTANAKKAKTETTCYNPATGEILGTSALHVAGDAKEAVERARAAQPAWAARSIQARCRAILRIRNYIAEHADDLALTIARDNGKTRTDALSTEILPATMAASYYASHAACFLKERSPGLGALLLANKRSKIIRVPVGVMAVISPWNYPFAIAFSEVVMGLLAGNAVILKTASQTQMVGRALEECMQAGGLPDGIFTYLNLPGAVAGDALLEAGVDKLFFTGSVPVGKKLMAKAAETLTRVSLELGGNDAMVVCPDADLERAASGAVWAGLQNCGQSCGGVERIYVHRDVYEPFLELLAEKVRKLRIGYDTDFNVDLGAMTTTSQVALVKRHVDDALKKGAKIYAQTSVPEGNTGNFIPAMVLTDVDHTMDVMRDETFGPVLGVMKVQDMEQAIELANDSNLGLTGSVWSRDCRAAEKLARRIQAGVIMVNDHLMSHGLSETPWGGFKESGIGRTHGDIGFAEMTESRCIVHDILPGVKKNFWWHPHSANVYSGLRGIIDLMYGKDMGKRLSGMVSLLGIFPRTFKADDPGSDKFNVGG